MPNQKLELAKRTQNMEIYASGQMRKSLSGLGSYWHDMPEEGLVFSHHALV